VRTAHISETRHCPNCGRQFRTWRGDQKYCSQACSRRSHRRAVPLKYRVVSVGTSAGEGYPFSVSIGGGAPEDDFFMFATGFIHWPRKRNGQHRHFMSKPMRAKISGSLRKQVWAIVETKDERLDEQPRGMQKQTKQPKIEQQPPEPTKINRQIVLSPCCHQECVRTFAALPACPETARWQCTQCQREYLTDDSTLERAK